MFKKNDIIQLKITDIGKDGEGIGKIDTFPFFIKDTVVGDEVEALVMKIKKSYAYARLKRIIKPSPRRVNPECAAARACGGCQIQELSYDAQLEYKQNTVLGNLSRIGGVDREYLESIAEPITGMDRPRRYRNKCIYPVGKTKDGRIIAGFYARHTHSIVECEDCIIGRQYNSLIKEAVTGWMSSLGIEPFDEESQSGCVRHIMIREAFSTGQICVVVSVNESISAFMKRKGAADSLKEALLGLNETIISRQNVRPSETVTEGGSPAGQRSGDRLYHVRPIGAVTEGRSPAGQRSGDRLYHVRPIGGDAPGPGICSIWIGENRTDGNRVMSEKFHLIYGSEVIEDELMGLRFRISPQSFYQVNPVQTEKLYETAIEFAGLKGGEEVWDVCCGIGTISLAVASRLKDGVVHGIEIVESAIENAKANAALNGIGNADFFCASAESFLPENLDSIRADVIILDPPRKGMEREAIDAILKVGAEKIVYVSCDPATLSRDVKLLTEGGYELKRVRATDMFCHSCHVESCVLLQRVSNTRPKAITLDVDLEDYYRIKGDRTNG